MKILPKRNVEKEILLFRRKKPSFCEKLGSQIKFCAYVIYGWYLSLCWEYLGFPERD